jgi:SAM-dependent methyltransferase
VTVRQPRNLIFGEAADTYDAHRPDYPSEVVNQILGMTEVDKAVEIGAGTGKATSRFAENVLEILCLEPSAAMAAVLEARGLKGVTVETISFEGWGGPEQPVDLIYAAQAWHWVDPVVGYQRALNYLRPGGLLALIWNVPIDRYQRFVDVYRELAPEILGENDERIGKRDSQSWLGDLSTAGFVDTTVLTHLWAETLSSVEFRQLCSTYSDHMMVPEPRRTRLLDALESAVGVGGGSVDIHYETRAFVGRKPAAF